MKNLIDYKYEFLVLDFCNGFYCGNFGIQEIVGDLYCHYSYSVACELCKPILDYMYLSAL